MNVQSNHAAAAKLIRAELKKHGIKASVKAKSYSGGSSVDVYIDQDITPAALKEINSFVGQFEYGHFDGSDDSYHYSNRRADLPQVRFTFVHVAYSAELYAAAEAYIANISGIHEHDRQTLVHRAISGAYGDFWTSRKPRVRVAA